MGDTVTLETDWSSDIQSEIKGTPVIRHKTYKALMARAQIFIIKIRKAQDEKRKHVEKETDPFREVGETKRRNQPA